MFKFKEADTTRRTPWTSTDPPSLEPLTRVLGLSPPFTGKTRAIMRRTHLRKEQPMLKTIGKILKFIVIAYIALFAVMLGMIMMTNAMLATL